MKARYWDSDMFLGWLIHEPDKERACRAVLREAEAGRLLIVTSALTIAEVLWIRGQPKLSRDQAEQIERFFKHKYIAFRNVDRTIAEAARQVVWDYDIRPKDAVHVATALDVHRTRDGGLDQFDTFDETLIRKSGQVGGNPSLKIGPPDIQETLF